MSGVPDTEAVAVVLPSPLGPNDPEPSPIDTTALDFSPDEATTIVPPVAPVTQLSTTSSMATSTTTTEQISHLGQVLVAGEPLADIGSTTQLIAPDTSVTASVDTDASVSSKVEVPATTVPEDSLIGNSVQVPSSMQSSPLVTTGATNSPEETPPVTMTASSIPPPPPTQTASSREDVNLSQPPFVNKAPASSPTSEKFSSSVSSVKFIPATSAGEDVIVNTSPNIPDAATNSTPTIPSGPPMDRPASTRSTQSVAAFADLSLTSTAHPTTTAQASSSASRSSAGLPHQGGGMALDVGDDASSTSSSSSVGSGEGSSSTAKPTHDEFNDVTSSSGTKNALVTSNSGTSASTASDTGAAAAVDASASSSSTGFTGHGQAQANAETKSEENGGKLNSIAIVGIVGGILVGLILMYLAWYQWRKKRAREALMELPDGPDDEKFMPYQHNSRITRSSFGAAEPITPWTSRRRRSSEDEESFGSGEGGRYDDEWYEPQSGYSGEYDQHGHGQQTEYLHDDRDPFDVPETAVPDGIDGRASYDLDVYGDGMTAALADGMSTAGPQTFRSSPAGNQNPFVPPVPPLPSSYSSNKHETVRAAPAVPDDVDPRYGTSIYDAYGTGPGGMSRPQREMMEPSTSNLLPWLNKNNPASHPPPVPPLPARHDESEDMHPHESIRAPPRALMAQTPIVGAPVGHGGELGVTPIPDFR